MPRRPLWPPVNDEAWKAMKYRSWQKARVSMEK
jgi:hypothetical protein